MAVICAGVGLLRDTCDKSCVSKNRSDPGSTGAVVHQTHAATGRICKPVTQRPPLHCMASKYSLDSFSRHKSIDSSLNRGRVEKETMEYMLIVEAPKRVSLAFIAVQILPSRAPHLALST